MQKIIKILYVEKRKRKDAEDYTITHALLETGEVVSGYGTEFEIGDSVEYWWEERYNKVKMVKGDNHGNA